MNKIFLIALIVAAPLAHAGRTAQDAAITVRDCDLIGKIGKAAYTARKANNAFVLPEPVKALHTIAIAEWAVDYGTKHAIDDADAYRMSYAKCEDNLPRVYKNLNAGRKTTAAELE